MVDLFTGVTTLVFGIGAYALSGNLLLTILGLVVGAMIARTLKPYVLLAWEKKHPSSDIVLFREEGTKTGVLTGAHILVMTQGVCLDCGTNGGRKQIERLYQDAVASLRGSSEVFRFRFDYVKEKSLPMRISYACAGDRDLSVQLRYFKWMKSLGNVKNSVEDRDAFSFDAEIPGENGSCPALVQFIFDSHLPVPEAAGEE